MYEIQSCKKESVLFLKLFLLKTTMPILECILVDASTDVIKLTANDMELGIETRIEGDILEREVSSH